MALRDLGTVLQAQRIRRLLDDLVAGGRRRIVLDLGGLDYTGALAAAGVAAGYARGLPRDIEIGIVVGDARASELLARTGVSEWLHVRPAGESRVRGP